jgi:hypothetical protein
MIAHPSLPGPISLGVASNQLGESLSAPSSSGASTSGSTRRRTKAATGSSPDTRTRPCPATAAPVRIDRNRPVPSPREPRAMPGIRIPIDDPDDPRLAPYRHLKTHNLTCRAGQFVVEGDKLLDRLLASRFPVTSVLVSERSEAPVAPRVPGGVPLYVMPHAKVEALVGFHLHRGVLACGTRLFGPGLDALVAGAEPGPGSTLIVCPQIDNPENLGTILRIADVFGVRAVVTGRRCPDPLSRRVLRVSMGMALRVPVVVPDDLVRSLDGPPPPPRLSPRGHGAGAARRAARPVCAAGAARRPPRLRGARPRRPVGVAVRRPAHDPDAPRRRVAQPRRGRGCRCLPPDPPTDRPGPLNGLAPPGTRRTTIHFHQLPRTASAVLHPAKK